jgi:hypothetical protein
MIQTIADSPPVVEFKTAAMLGKSLSEFEPQFAHTTRAPISWSQNLLQSFSFTTLRRESMSTPENASKENLADKIPCPALLSFYNNGLLKPDEHGNVS